MAGIVQKRIQFIYNTVYHQGLVKILIEFHLEILGDTWEKLLIRNHFQERDQEQPSSSKEKSGRKIKIENEKPLQEQSKDEIPIVKLFKKLKEQADKRKEDNIKENGKYIKAEELKINKSKAKVENHHQLVRRSYKLKKTVKEPISKET